MSSDDENTISCIEIARCLHIRFRFEEAAWCGEGGAVDGFERTHGAPNGVVNVCKSISARIIDDTHIYIAQ